MEVVARKKEGLLPLFIILLAVGTVTLSGGIVCLAFGGYTLIPGIVLTCLASVAVIFIAIGWIRWVKTPSVIITVEGNEMQLAAGRYALSDILNVTYRCPLKTSWGRLCVELKNKTVSCDFVEDVVETQQALISLRLSSSGAPIDC